MRRALTVMAMLAATPAFAMLDETASPEALRPDTTALSQPKAELFAYDAEAVAACRVTLAQVLGAPYPGQTATEARSPLPSVPREVCILE